jgi:hypothetical protein
MTQMRKKTFTSKRFSQESMCVPFLPLPIMGTVNIMTVGSFIVSNQLIAGSIMVRHMKLILVLSLPLRGYCLMKATHNILQGVIMTSLVLVHDHTFGCVSCLWQDLQDLFDHIVLGISFQ